jgi:SlyX protein
MDETTRKMQERLAYLERTVEELSDVVAGQAKVLDVTERRIEALMRRAAESELDAGGTAPLADQRPPHW